MPDKVEELAYIARMLKELQLYAWVGWNEFYPGELGIKQGRVPAGVIPMVSLDREKLEQYWPQAQAQTIQYGRTIYLVRFEMAEVLKITRGGM